MLGLGSMTKSGDIKAGVPRARAGRPGSKLDEAFDAWLDRELRRMFDDVAREPIPEDLLKLIDEHADAARRNPTAPKKR